MDVDGNVFALISPQDTLGWLHIQPSCALLQALRGKCVADGTTEQSLRGVSAILTALPLSTGNGASNAPTPKLSKNGTRGEAVNTL